MARFLIGLIPILLLFLIAFVLGKYNAHEASINLLLMQAEVTMATILAGSLLVGFVLGLLVVSLGYVKLSWQTRRLKKVVRQLSKFQAENDASRKV